MQTLGLSGETKRSDGRLKSIFWPTVENAWDVDYLGRQGFWICLVIAVFQVIAGTISMNPLALASSIAAGVVFILGGMGVRESNWPAAALVFSIYFVGLLHTLALGGIPGVLAIIAAGILLSNLRATFLASGWRPAAEDEDRPTRFNETISDKLFDRLPAKAWPVLRMPFFALSTLLLLLSLVGVASTLLVRFGLLPRGGVLHP